MRHVPSGFRVEAGPGSAPLPNRYLNRLGGTSFESKVSGDALRASDESDIVDQQSSHPFPFPVWSFGVLPTSVPTLVE